jgi:uncharacterized protein involved in cysteine biosynthesis
LPVGAAKEGIKLSEEAADALIRQVAAIVQNGTNDLQKQVELRISELETRAVSYLYVAAAVLFVILLIPAIVGSIVTVWMMRWMDRRRAQQDAI